MRNINKVMAIIDFIAMVICGVAMVLWFKEGHLTWSIVMAIFTVYNLVMFIFVLNQLKRS